MIRTRGRGRQEEEEEAEEGWVQAGRTIGGRGMKVKKKWVGEGGITRKTEGSRQEGRWE